MLIRKGGVEGKRSSNMFAVAAFLCLAGLVNSGRSDNSVLGSRPQYILFSVQRYALYSLHSLPLQLRDHKTQHVHVLPP